jgi:hypothetical protein
LSSITKIFGEEVLLSITDHHTPEEHRHTPEERHHTPEEHHHVEEGSLRENLNFRTRERVVDVNEEEIVSHLTINVAEERLISLRYNTLSNSRRSHRRRWRVRNLITIVMSILLKITLGA